MVIYDDETIDQLKALLAAIPESALSPSYSGPMPSEVIGNAIAELKLRQNSVVQLWVHGITRMQQSVLFAAIRGPDGIDKNHISKKLVRWMRRCVLKAAFDNLVYPVPYDPQEAGWKSGSFTGPSCYRLSSGQFASTARQEWEEQSSYATWQQAMDEVVSNYLQTVDALPHHYQLHFMHAAEIIGYKHPWPEHRKWWHRTYVRLANDMHLLPEPEDVMDRRLGDSERQWREAEEVTAHV